MFEILAAVGVAAGFVFVIRLIAGPDTGEPALSGLLTSPPMPARPRGVQETDLAPFVFRDAKPVAMNTVTPRAVEGRLDPARAA